jgi:hypothetical protein
MGLAKDDDVIQAFSTDRADEPFDLSILPGRTGRSWSVSNPQPVPPEIALGALSQLNAAKGLTLSALKVYIENPSLAAWSVAQDEMKVTAKRVTTAMGHPAGDGQCAIFASVCGS